MARSRRYYDVKINDAGCADDLIDLSGHLTEATIL